MEVFNLNKNPSQKEILINGLPDLSLITDEQINAISRIIYKDVLEMAKKNKARKKQKV